MSDNHPGGGHGPHGEDPGPQSRYYQRYEQTSGEAVTASNKTTKTRGGHKALYAAAAVVVAAAVTGGVVGVAALGNSDTQQAAGPAASSQPADTPSAATPSDPQTWTNPSADAPQSVRPLQPGWTAVLARSDLAPAAYDVPTKHWYKPGDMVYGYVAPGGGKPLTVGSASGYRHGFCKTDEGATLAFVGFRGIGSMDPAAEAPAVAAEFAKAISLKKDHKSHAHMSAVKTTNTTVQGLPGVQSTIVATDGDPHTKSCDAKKDEVRTLAVTLGDKSALLVLVRALDVPHALTDKAADAIMATLRPAQN